MAQIMTPRERLFAALNGQPTDHVPVWLLFPYHQTSYYADVRNNPCFQRIQAASENKVITLNRRHLPNSLFAPEVASSTEQFNEGSERVKRQTLTYKGQRLYSENRQCAQETRVKKMLTCEADLETYLSFPLNTDPALIHKQLDAGLAQYQAEAREFPAHMGAMMLSLGEPIGALYHASNLEEYAVWSLDHSERIENFLSKVMEQYRIVYRYCLERELADVYFLVGSELASPPLVSRATFKRWIVPFAKELIEMVHAHGKKVIQHYHGQIKQILPDFLEMNPDGLHTIEAPPIGNCTFADAFATTGDRIALIGNIQYDVFSSATSAEMAQAVRDVLEECKGRRLILSPSAGPYEHTISPQMIENYITFIQTAWEHPLK